MVSSIIKIVNWDDCKTKKQANAERREWRMDDEKSGTALYRAARAWARLARNEESGIKMGVVDPMSGAHRAQMFRRTAHTLLRQRKSGQAVCVCCFKQFD